jgi:hypothetical protein
MAKKSVDKKQVVVKQGGNRVLSSAKKTKQDEFYTQLADISNELKYYKSQLKGKIIFCNCDDPYESNFFRYFVLNFKTLGLKQLITTSFKPSPIANTQLGLFGTDKTVSTTKGRPKITANKFIINEVHDVNDDGAFDLRDIAEKLKANKHNEWAPLVGDGDFRSPECVELLKQADVVITNPPFSLFREYYLPQLIEHKKNFLIIAPDTALHYKEVFRLMRDNKLWRGYGRPQQFTQPDGTIKKFGNIGWLTNLDTTKRHELLPLYKKYSPEEYPHYDNYDAIDVRKTAEIPADHDGLMGVPDAFLDKFNPEQFELIGIPFGDLGKEIGVTKNYRGRTDVSITKNGKSKCPYSRIIIKRKK